MESGARRTYVLNEDHCIHIDGPSTMDLEDTSRPRRYMQPTKVHGKAVEGVALPSVRKRPRSESYRDDDNNQKRVQNNMLVNNTANGEVQYEEETTIDCGDAKQYLPQQSPLPDQSQKPRRPSVGEPWKVSSGGEVLRESPSSASRRTRNSNATSQLINLQIPGASPPTSSRTVDEIVDVDDDTAVPQRPVSHSPPGREIKFRNLHPNPQRRAHISPRTFYEPRLVVSSPPHMTASRKAGAATGKKSRKLDDKTLSSRANANSTKANDNTIANVDTGDDVTVVELDSAKNERQKTAAPSRTPATRANHVSTAPQRQIGTRGSSSPSSELPASGQTATHRETEQRRSARLRKSHGTMRNEARRTIDLSGTHAQSREAINLDGDDESSVASADSEPAQATNSPATSESKVEKIFESSSSPQSRPANTDTASSPAECAQEAADEPVHILFEFPPGERGKIRVTSEELTRLRNHQYLNDSLIDFYVKYLDRSTALRSSQLRMNCMFFSSFFFGRLRRANPIDYEGVQRWTNNVDLFEKQFVFVPVCDSYHWSLVIVANLRVLHKFIDESADVKDVAPHERPKILYMDSLDPRRGNQFGRAITQYLAAEWVHRKTQSTDIAEDRKTMYKKFEKVMKIEKPDVPMQSNEYDCGLYVLTNMAKFLDDARGMREELLASGSTSKRAKVWYTHADVHALRHDMMHLISNMQESVGLKRKDTEKDASPDPDNSNLVENEHRREESGEIGRPVEDVLQMPAENKSVNEDAKSGAHVLSGSDDSEMRNGGVANFDVPPVQAIEEVESTPDSHEDVHRHALALESVEQEHSNTTAPESRTEGSAMHEQEVRAGDGHSKANIGCDGMASVPDAHVDNTIQVFEYAAEMRDGSQMQDEHDDAPEIKENPRGCWDGQSRCLGTHMGGGNMQTVGDDGGDDSMKVEAVHVGNGGEEHEHHYERSAEQGIRQHRAHEQEVSHTQHKEEEVMEYEHPTSFNFLAEQRTNKYNGTAEAMDESQSMDTEQGVQEMPMDMTLHSSCAEDVVEMSDWKGT